MDPRLQPAQAVVSLLTQFFKPEIRSIVAEHAFDLVEICLGNDGQLRAKVQALFRSISILPPLDPLWEKAADEWQCAKMIGMVPLSKFQRLQPRVELDNNIMDGYLDLIRKLSGPKVFVATTKLLLNCTPNHNVDVEINLEMSSYSAIKVLIPIQECGHWILAVLTRDGFSTTATIFDSSLILRHPSHPYTYDGLASWLEAVGLDSMKMSLENPQQNKFANDSGLFVLLRARLEAADLAMPSEAETRIFMPAFRRRVFAELLAHHLDPSPAHYQAFERRDEAGFRHSTALLEGVNPQELSRPTLAPDINNFITTDIFRVNNSIPDDPGPPQPTETLTEEPFGEDFDLMSWSGNSPLVIADESIFQPTPMAFPGSNDLDGDPVTPQAQVPDERIQGRFEPGHSMALRSRTIEPRQLPTPASEHQHVHKSLFVTPNCSPDSDCSPSDAGLVDLDMTEGHALDSADSVDECALAVTGVERLMEQEGEESTNEDLFTQLGDEHQPPDDLSGSDCGDEITEPDSGPHSVRHETVAKIMTFYPPTDDLQQLPEMLRISLDEAQTVGAIKISLQPSLHAFDLRLDRDVMNFQLQQDSQFEAQDYLALDRWTCAGKMQKLFLPNPTPPRDPNEEYLEGIVSDFFASLKNSNPVQYFVDIDVHRQEDRSNLNLPPSKITDLPGDRLPLTNSTYDGVHTPLATASKEYGTPFTFHEEDFELCALNHLLYGEPKVWVVVSPSSKSEFETLVRSMLLDEQKDCSQFVRHSSLLIPPSRLRESGINYSIILQQVGEIIFTFPGTYHQGYNMGENFGESVNYAIVDAPMKRYIPCTTRCHKGILPITAKGMRTKLPSSKRKRSTETYVGLSTLVPQLQEAVLMHRYLKNRKAKANSLGALYRVANPLGKGSGGIENVWNLRIAREQYARQYNELIQSGASSQEQMEKLGVSDRASCEEMGKFANRVSFWASLRDIFKDDLLEEESYVALCAILSPTEGGGSRTSQFERMIETEKQDWLAEVRYRKEEFFPVFQLVLPSLMFVLGFVEELPVQGYEDSMLTKCMAGTQPWESMFCL